MRRRHLRVLVGMVCGVAALAAAGVGTAANGVADSQLLRKYQPVLVFHPAEQFRPAKIQSFVADSQLEQFVGTSPAELPIDAFWTVIDRDPQPGALGSLPPGTYRLNQSECSAAATLAGADCYADAAASGSGGAAMYGRVSRTNTHTVLQYWLFYHHNPLLLPPTPFGTFWQSHEGDWEVVNVILDAAGRPVEAAYSRHCTGERRAWGAVEKRPAGSTHPVAYVGLGSHANFFTPGVGPLGLAPIDLDCIPPSVRMLLPFLPFLQVADQVLDGTAVGAVAGPPGSGAEPATIHRIEGMPWSTFAGRWGESEYFFTPVPLGPLPANTAVPVGLGPASPPLQKHWEVSTVLGWPLVP